jgi:hypothetical protein
MSGAETSDLSSLPEGTHLQPPQNDLGNFVTQVRGDLQFTRVHVGLYPNVISRRTETGKAVTLQDLNYHVFLCRLIVVSLVSTFEAFMEMLCRKALLRRHNLFGQFDPSVSWKQIPESGTVDTLWEALADQVLVRLESGKLRTFAKVFKKLGVTLPSLGSKQGKALEELIRRRNVIVHNKGKPDKHYLEIVSSPKTYPSGALVIDISYVEEACGLLINTSRAIVQQLIKKGTLEPSELEGEPESSAR